MPRFNIQSQCEICGVERSKFTSRKFKAHYDLHLGLVFNCEACNKDFPTKEKLQDHKRFVHCLQTECDICKKTFSNQNKNFKQHKLTHVQEVMAFYCDQCDKQFGLLRSNYRVKDIESNAHGLKLYRCVLHMNAYNV